MGASQKRDDLIDQSETLKSIRADLGLNRKEFSEYMGIPLRSLEDWEAAKRKMPDYVLRLIAYYTRIEKMLRDNGSITREEVDRESKDIR